MQAMLLAKAFLHCAETVESTRQTFNGCYVFAVGLNGEKCAALYCFAVEQHCACATVGCVAADVCTGEARIFTDVVNEEGAIFYLVLLFCSVDGDAYGGHYLLLPFIARQTFSGVTGMSICSTPNDESAFTIALTTAGGLPTAPDSPIPFAPSGLFGHRVVIRPAV